MLFIMLKHYFDFPMQDDVITICYYSVEQKYSFS